jgi:hypothetical protein
MVNTHMNHHFASAGGLYTGPQVDNRYIVPRFVERTSQGVREYDPYAKLFEERVIFLGVQIDDASANDVMAQLLCLESIDPDRDISIYINSPGGSFTALTAIYDTMQFVKPDIQTVCMGQAASAAAVTSRPRRPAVSSSPTWRSRPTKSCVCAPSWKICWQNTPPRRSRRSATTSSVTRFSRRRTRSHTAWSTRLFRPARAP